MTPFPTTTLSPLFPPRRSRRAAQGFTLLEVLFATVLISLILAGVVDLFLSASKLTVRANAIAATALSSANAVQQILKDAREAQALSMPDDVPPPPNQPTNGVPTFKPLASYPNIASYKATTPTGQTVVTALELSIPAQPLTSVTVMDSHGSSKTPSLYNRAAAGGDYILFYRGKPDQTPDPSSGKCLWKYQHSTNTATPICRNIAKAADAVQFIQPSGRATQVAVKIVSSEYSLINGQQTNEKSDGSTTSSLTGKCVLMRDAGTNGASQDHDTCNHAFQPGN